ncbi:hypothetical protein F5B19DRAFT_379755 [Rostrohypoxylon terebratum]|nr:hypothetical protein F5B19DRAFT_379755 [Rostrohypoxylon terebratum]
MQFTTFIVAAAALALGVSADGPPHPIPRLAQFRVFGAVGCSDLNYGFYTVEPSEVNTCNKFKNVPEGPGVKAVSLEVVYKPECKVRVYTDDNCTAGTTALSPSTCSEVSPRNPSWVSWKVEC